MKNIVIGQYVPGKGFFYRLDPRTKIIAIVFLPLLAAMPRLRAELTPLFSWCIPVSRGSSNSARTAPV